MEGRKNLAWGFIALALFMAGGFFLGYMHDLAPDKEAWISQYAAGRHFELRLAHVHGSLFGLINVAIGLALMKLPLAPRQARAVSWLALAGILMPVGIIGHVLLGVPPVLVFVGGLSMIAATLWLGIAALALDQSRRQPGA